MALENLTPENRVERLLSGADLEPANRLEYFLKQAGSGGGLPVVFVDYTDDGATYTSSKTWEELFAMMQTALVVFRYMIPNVFINCYYISTMFYDEDGYYIIINEGANQMTWVSNTSDGYPSYNYD